MAASVLACLWLTACKTTSESMQVTDAGFMAKPAGSIYVQVGDGKDNAAVMEVSDPELKEAIEQSIQTAGLFAPVLKSQDNADYLLYAALVRKDQALVSLSSATGVELYWRLINLRDSDIIWSDTIITQESGGVEGLIGNNRNAGSGNAIRANIKEAMQAIHKLELKPL